MASRSSLIGSRSSSNAQSERFRIDQTVFIRRSVNRDVLFVSVRPSGTGLAKGDDNVDNMRSPMLERSDRSAVRCRWHLHRCARPVGHRSARFRVRPAARSREHGDNQQDGEGRHGEKRTDFTVAVIGDQNYGCDLDVSAAALVTFQQVTTVPKCSGPLADDIPAPTGLQIRGRLKSNAMIEAINAVGVAFTIHDGETKSGSTECTALGRRRRNPTESHGTACRTQDSTTARLYARRQRVDRLPSVRGDTASEAPQSQGRTTMPLTTQPGYPENARWQRGPVVFVTINQPGSNSNFCSPNQNTDICDENGEATNRNRANIAWMLEPFSGGPMTTTRRRSSSWHRETQL